MPAAFSSRNRWATLSRLPSNVLFKHLYLYERYLRYPPPPTYTPRAPGLGPIYSAPTGNRGRRPVGEKGAA